MAPIKFHCPVDGGTILTIDDGTWSFTGVEIGDMDVKSIKCGTHKRSIVPEQPERREATVKLGGEVLQPGDWIALDFGVNNHHTIYVGQGNFIGRSEVNDGVEVEPGEEYADKKGHLVHRGGQGAADKARARIRDGKGWNLLFNNCEHFCSECCGLGRKSEQVKVGMTKLGGTAGAMLANRIKTNLNVQFRSAISGGFGSGGGGSIGFSFRC